MPSTRHVRVRTGCWTCRFRKKKCDEARPACEQCSHLKLVCDGYDGQPVWMKDNDMALKKKEEIKQQMVRRSRRRKKNQDLSRQLQQQQQTSAPKSNALATPPIIDDDVEKHTHNRTSRPKYAGPALKTTFEEQDHDASLTLSSPEESATDFQVFNMSHVAWSIDDLHNSDTPRSIYSSPRNAVSPTTSSSFPPSRALTRESSLEEVPTFGEGLKSPSTGEHTPKAVSPYKLAIPSFESHNIPIQMDRKLDADLANLYLRTIFGVTYRALSDEQVTKYNRALIVPMFFENKSFFHGCLSSTALHLTATNVSETQRKGLMTEVFKHRHKSLNSLKQQIAQSRTPKQRSAIAATICALISFEVFSRKTEWQVHIKAATDCVKLLGWTTAPPEDPGEWFIYSRILWLDIIASITSGKAPYFSDFYSRMLFYPPSMRTRNRLVEMTGCEDSVLYIISEITCLEEWKFKLLTKNPQAVLPELIRRGSLLDEQLVVLGLQEGASILSTTQTRFGRNGFTGAYSSLQATCSSPVSPIVSFSGSDFDDDDEDDFDDLEEDDHDDIADDEDLEDFVTPGINDVADIPSIERRVSIAGIGIADYRRKDLESLNINIHKDVHAADVFLQQSDPELIEDRETFRKAVTAAFRIMARVYLAIVMHGFNPTLPEFKQLLGELIVVVTIIPSGYMGYERSIIVPLLIGGSLAVTEFEREFFLARLRKTTHMAKYGNLGNVDKILREVWSGWDNGIWATNMSQEVPWRKVMKDKNWEYLLV